jgi:calcineurin-like phosphoesterase family protein
MNIFLTSDLHFGHVAQAKLRGFNRGIEGNTDLMDQILVANWNEVVGPKDEVYVLGDVSFRNSTMTEALCKELRGRVFVIPGNHDSNGNLKAMGRCGWAILSQLERRKLIPGQHKVTLCHYPLLTWANGHHGAYHFHGHSHGNLKAPPTTRVDVGVDCWNLSPVSLDTLVSLLSTRAYQPVDHHEAKTELGPK